MKPDRAIAMRMLIDQIRQALPFTLEQSRLCQGPCQGCPKKLLEYLDSELVEQELALERGQNPTFGAIKRLATRARKISNILVRNKIISHT